MLATISGLNLTRFLEENSIPPKYLSTSDASTNTVNQDYLWYELLFELDNKQHNMNGDSQTELKFKQKKRRLMWLKPLEIEDEWRE